MVTFGNLITVLYRLCQGGFNQTGFLASVESYCPASNQWTYVTDMPVARSGMGVGVTMEPCPGCLPEEEDSTSVWRTYFRLWTLQRRQKSYLIPWGWVDSWQVSQSEWFWPLVLWQYFTSHIFPLHGIGLCVCVCVLFRKQSKSLDYWHFLMNFDYSVNKSFDLYICGFKKLKKYNLFIR